MNTDQKAARFTRLLSNPLAFAALALMAIRTRRIESFETEDNCNIGEFLFSSRECEKFGLESTQHGQLERVIKFLEKYRYIRDSGRRTKSGSKIFGLTDMSVFAPEFTIK